MDQVLAEALGEATGLPLLTPPTELPRPQHRPQPPIQA